MQLVCLFTSDINENDPPRSCTLGGIICLFHLEANGMESNIYLSTYQMLKDCQTYIICIHCVAYQLHIPFQIADAEEWWLPGILILLDSINKSIEVTECGGATASMFLPAELSGTSTGNTCHHKKSEVKAWGHEFHLKNVVKAILVL